MTAEEVRTWVAAHIVLDIDHRRGQVRALRQQLAEMARISESLQRALATNVRTLEMLLEMQREEP